LIAGKGGFGRVYQVEHTLTGRREAMTVLAASSSPEQAERFLREIKLQALVGDRPMPMHLHDRKS
jgi:serine/threonine protein kinase